MLARSWELSLLSFLSPAACLKAMDVGIVLDTSGSVRSENFKKATEFVANLVGHLTISAQGTHVGVISYASTPSLQFNFAKAEYHNLGALQAAIRGVKFTGGGTRTDLALEMASNHLFTPGAGDRNQATNVLIVLTDGKTNRGSKPYIDVLKPLQVQTE